MVPLAGRRTHMWQRTCNVTKLGLQYQPSLLFRAPFLALRLLARPADVVVERGPQPVDLPTWCTSSASCCSCQYTFCCCPACSRAASPSSSGSRAPSPSLYRPCCTPWRAGDGIGDEGGGRREADTRRPRACVDRVRASANRVRARKEGADEQEQTVRGSGAVEGRRALALGLRLVSVAIAPRFAVSRRLDRLPRLEAGAPRLLDRLHSRTHFGMSAQRRSHL